MGSDLTCCGLHILLALASESLGFRHDSQDFVFVGKFTPGKALATVLRMLELPEG